MKNSILESIFKPVSQDVIRNPNPRISSNNYIKKGSLISFNYTFWKNDPYPLVIVNESFVSKGIWGINLHYLTFNYIKIAIRNCKNPMFSFKGAIKNTQLENAYRSYKWQGVRQVKVLDCDFLLDVIGTIKSYDPAEIQIIRKNVQEQINKKINPKSYEINTKTLNKEGSIPPQIVPTVKTVPNVKNNQ